MMPLKNLWELSCRYPSKSLAIINGQADLGMILSGLLYGNYWRVAAGGVGLYGNIGLFLYGDPKPPLKTSCYDGLSADHALSAIDPQDQTFQMRMKNTFKLDMKNYPMETNAVSCLLQLGLLTFLSGPNLKSLSDVFRPGETANGALSIAGNVLTVLVSDQRTNVTSNPQHSVLKVLRDEFNSAGRFVKRRLQDIRDNKLNLRATWESACTDIARFGPNQFGARLGTVGLFGYTAESAILQDWRMLASCGLYALGNFYWNKISKRRDLAPT